MLGRARGISRSEKLEARLQKLEFSEALRSVFQLLASGLASAAPARQYGKAGASLPQSKPQCEAARLPVCFSTMTDTEDADDSTLGIVLVDHAVVANPDSVDVL